MLVLGIDPGSQATGFGLVAAEGGRLRQVDCGVVRCPAGEPLPARLLRIHGALRDIIAAASPDAVAVESVFSARNARSALVLGHARGVALLAAAERELPVAEYAPREVKMALTGQGGASKEQVRFMVQRLLGRAAPPSSLDASDALGVALCHVMRRDSPAARLQAKGGGR